MSAIFGDGYPTIFLYKAAAGVQHTIVLPRYGTTPSYASGTPTQNQSTLVSEERIKINKSGKPCERTAGIDGAAPQTIGFIGYRYEAELEVYIGEADSGIEQKLIDAYDWEDLTASPQQTVWFKPHNDIDKYWLVHFMNDYNNEFLGNYKQIKITIELVSQSASAITGESALPDSSTP